MCETAKDMAKAGEELETISLWLSVRTFLTAPHECRNPSASSDGIHGAWRSAIHATLTASIACERLAAVLRERAQVTDPGPTERFLAQMRSIEEP